MIFVILGTQDKPFTRLIELVEAIKQENIIQEDVIVQSGTTKYDSKDLKIVPFMDMQQFNDTITKANYVIAHGGVGTIMTCLNNHKKVIALPRLGNYGEHENDHQLQIVESFAASGYILGCNDKVSLIQCIEQIDTFAPKPWQSNKQALIDDIKKELGL